MKLLLAASLISVALAIPTNINIQDIQDIQDIQEVQDIQDTQDVQECGVSFVWARGSAEPAPLGPIIGMRLESALKKKIPNMKTYPVMYGASLLTNLSPQRTDDGSIKEGVKAFQQANTACPSSEIIAGGYSQGAAVMHNVIGKSLSAEIKNKIVGVALFGDTRNKQDNSHIPNFPKDRSRVWCNKDDGVCDGNLLVNAGHLSYSDKDINEAADWLSKQLKGGGGGGGGDSGESPAPKAAKGKGSAPKSKGGDSEDGSGKGGGKGKGGSKGKGGGKGKGAGKGQDV